MNLHRLILTIANIQLSLNTYSHKDYIFLQKAYQAYINRTPKSNNSTKFTIIHTCEKPYGIRIQKNSYIVNCPPAQSNFFLFSYYIRQIFLKELIRHGGCILHASSLIYKDKAYIFIGKSGAGKTTMRNLFPELSSLGDDIALVNKKYGIWSVWGSPFFQRSRMIYPNEKIPIASIYEIKQSKCNKKYLLSPNIALQCLFQYSFSASKAVQTEVTTTNHLFKTWMALSRAVPFYRLHFSRDRRCKAMLFTV